VLWAQEECLSSSAATSVSQDFPVTWILLRGLACRAVVERKRPHRMIGCGDLRAQCRLADLPCARDKHNARVPQGFDDDRADAADEQRCGHPLCLPVNGCSKLRKWLIA
jgi:hypothetical protein